MTTRAFFLFLCFLVMGSGLWGTSTTQVSPDTQDFLAVFGFSIIVFCQLMLILLLATVGYYAIRAYKALLISVGAGIMLTVIETTLFSAKLPRPGSEFWTVTSGIGSLASICFMLQLFQTLKRIEQDEEKIRANRRVALTT